MKKSLKKLFAVLSALAIILTLPTSALAASVTRDEAKAIALNDSGFKEDSIIYVKVKADNENGTAVWDVEFTASALGLYHEFDYTVRKSDGAVLDKEYELESAPFSDNDERIDKEVAKGLAAKEFNIPLKDAKFIKTESDYDDGVKVYEIEFVSADVKYSCEISANGRISEKEVENIDSLEEKIEVAFELLIAWILSLFSK